MNYDFASIEKKWQDIWEEKNIYAAENGGDKPKFFGLVEFPYPSAAGLHVGHPRPYTAMDIIARKKRMDGNNAVCRPRRSLFPLTAIFKDCFPAMTGSFLLSCCA